MRLFPTDTRAYLDRRDIHYVVVDDGFLDLTGENLDGMLARYEGRLIQKVIIPSYTYRFKYLYLIQLNH